MMDVLFANVAPISGEVQSLDGRRKPRQPRSTAEAAKPLKVEPLLSINEAADQFGIPRRRLDAAINGGELAFYPIGERARKVRASDIQAWLEKKRTVINGQGVQL